MNNEEKVHALCMKLGGCVVGEDYNNIIMAASKLIAFTVLKSYPEDADKLEAIEVAAGFLHEDLAT